MVAVIAWLVVGFGCCWMVVGVLVWIYDGVLLLRFVDTIGGLVGALRCWGWFVYLFCCGFDGLVVWRMLIW